MYFVAILKQFDFADKRMCLSANKVDVNFETCVTSFT